MSVRLLMGLCVAGVLVLVLLGCTDGGGGDRTPTVAFTVVNTSTGAVTAPLWMAFQDGSEAPWQVLIDNSIAQTRAVARGAGVYRVPVTNPTGAYSFAVVGEIGGSTCVRILRSTLAESTTPVVGLPMGGTVDAFSRRSRSRYTGTWTLTGSVQNPPANVEHLSYATPCSSGSSSEVNMYTLNFPADQPSDGWLLWVNQSDTALTGAWYIRRNVAEEAGTTVTENIDYATQCHALSDLGTFSVAGAMSLVVEFRSAGGAKGTLRGTDSSSIKYPLLPDAALLPGDRYVFRAFDGYGDARFYSHDTNVTVTLADPFTCLFDNNVTPAIRNLSTEGTLLYRMDVGVGLWELYVTSGWLRAANSTSVIVPTFADTTNGVWNSAWNLPTPLPDVYAYRSEYTTSLDFLLLRSILAYPFPAPPEDSYIKTAAYQAYPSD